MPRYPDRIVLGQCVNCGAGPHEFCAERLPRVVPPRRGGRRMNTTDRLRQAAQKIREATAKAPPLSAEAWAREMGREVWGGHIALWSPPVALAVADWLEDIAADKDSGLGCIHPRALDVADLILGGDQ